MNTAPLNLDAQNIGRFFSSVSRQTGIILPAPADLTLGLCLVEHHLSPLALAALPPHLRVPGPSALLTPPVPVPPSPAAVELASDVAVTKGRLNIPLTSAVLN